MWIEKYRMTSESTGEVVVLKLRVRRRMGSEVHSKFFNLLENVDYTFEEPPGNKS